MENEFIFDKKIICPTDPTATAERIEQYKNYYKIKYELCKGQNPKRIAEIGVRAGYSAWSFLQACPSSKYIGFDANNGMHGGKGGEDGSFFQWTKKILSEYDYELIELDTQTVNDLRISNIDFFHVDGDHTTKGVIHDLSLAYEAINEKGLILVDDITYLKEVNLGVTEWLRIMDRKVIIKFIPSLRGEMLIRKGRSE